MNFFRRHDGLCGVRTALIAAFAVQLGTVAFAQHRPQVHDVALRSGGVLVGNVSDRQGSPAGQCEIALFSGGQEIARTTASADGNFAFRALRGGVYQLASTDSVVTFRAWATATAPPVAKSAIQLYDGGGAVIRAQCGCKTSLMDRISGCCGCGKSGKSSGTHSAGDLGGTMADASGDVPMPAPVASTEEMRDLAPDLPEEQFAAFTRADVVIINPDHYSVAISYDAATGTATVVAKAIDDVALQVQASARAGGIPVVQRAPLARALYEVAVGAQVPANLLPQIVEIMAGLAPAAAPAAAGVGAVAEVGGVGLGGQVLVGAGILGAAVAIPVAATTADTEDENPHAS